MRLRLQTRIVQRTSEHQEAELGTAQTNQPTQHRDQHCEAERPAYPSVDPDSQRLSSHETSMPASFRKDKPHATGFRRNLRYLYRPNSLPTRER